jgi:hypothetical protein
MDHFLTSQCRVGGYVRYCDDFVLLGEDREKLKSLLADVKSLLERKRLRLHERKQAVAPTQAGRTFVGYRVWKSHRVLPRESVRRVRRWLRWMHRAYARGLITWEEVCQRWVSWMGHARQARSEHLLLRLIEEADFAAWGG